MFKSEEFLNTGSFLHYIDLKDNSLKNLSNREEKFPLNLFFEKLFSTYDQIIIKTILCEHQKIAVTLYKRASFFEHELKIWTNVFDLLVSHSLKQNWTNWSRIQEIRD